MVPFSTKYAGIDRFLLIGLGSSLRGDDAIGPLVAEYFFDHPAVEAVTAHGLLPEHADLLAQYRLALIVDACCHGTPGEVAVRRVEARASWHESHDMGLESLVGLAESLHGHAAQTILISVAAESFAIDRPLSRPVQAAMSQVAARINRLARRMMMRRVHA